FSHPSGATSALGGHLGALEKAIFRNNVAIQYVLCDGISSGGSGPGMSRVVCVSNRITLPRKSAAPGGLAVGIRAALKRSGGLWFGWSGETVDHDPGEPDIHIRDGVTYATIGLRTQDYENYYNGYANEVLWPLFHYFLKGMRYNVQQRDAYDSVNRMFAT